MPPLSLLIKPASSKCNLNCTYCFYHDVSANRMVKDHGVMNDEVLEMLIKKAFEYASFHIHFAFQGGEPTLAGIKYFYKFHDFVEKYNSKNINVSFSLQTNGTFLNEEWISLFNKYIYLIGLSLDGPEFVHDYFREDWNQKGSYKEVIRGLEYLQEGKVEFNVLTVVTKHTVDHIEEVYTFFKKMGFKFLQFIPCLDNINAPIDITYHLSSDLYEIFLKKTFELYKKDFMNKEYTSIRYFDNILGIFLGRNPESCDMMGRCSVNPVVESDGSVYPCDFYVLDQYKLGNVLDSSFFEILKSPIGSDFVQDSLGIPERCKTCPYLNICRAGGCKRQRNPESKANKFCDAYFNFFEMYHDDLVELAKLIKSGYLQK